MVAWQLIFTSMVTQAVEIRISPNHFFFWQVGGTGYATLNGEDLHKNYEIHFMVTQGMRNRKTLKADYPLLNKKSSAGEINPAAQQLDFYIRSPEIDERNNPLRKVFHHFFAMEITWK